MPARRRGVGRPDRGGDIWQRDDETIEGFEARVEALAIA
jgi:hypothetical protein